jgi:hypothetical protein
MKAPRPANSYKGVRRRENIPPDRFGDRWKIGASGTMEARDGKKIPIRRAQSICALFERTIEKEPGKTIRELGVSRSAQQLKAHSRNEVQVMHKVASKRPHNMLPLGMRFS